MSTQVTNILLKDNVLLFHDADAALKVCEQLGVSAEVFKYDVSGFFDTGLYGIERFSTKGCFMGYVRQDEI